MNAEFLWFTRATSRLPVSLRADEIASFSGNRDGSTYVTMKNREGFCIREGFHAVAAAVTEALA